MSLLNQVTKGRQKKPYFICVFGPEGVGKSSFGAAAPAPIFACVEDGANQLNIAKLPLIDKTETLLDAITELKTQTHEYKTLVIDSLDHLEQRMWNYVCRKNDWKNIEDPGYGKGYTHATEAWVTLFDRLKELRQKMNIILICHSQVKQFNDPNLPNPYERYELKLHKGANALIKENCDAVLFVNYDISVAIDKNTKKAKGFGGEDRFLYTQYRAAHDGKNRYGLPYKINLSWKSFEDAVLASDPENEQATVSTIEGLLSKVLDAETKQKATEQFEKAKASNDKMKLLAIKNRLEQIAQE